PAGRGHHIDMVPAVLIAEKGNPLAVGRGPRLRPRFAPVGNAPKFFFVYFMNRSRGTRRGVSEINEIFFEIFGFSVEYEMRWVNPSQTSVLAGLAEGDRFAAREPQRIHLTPHVFRHSIDDFCAGVRWGLVVMDDLRTAGVGDGCAVGGPHDTANAYVIVRDGWVGHVGELPYDKVDAAVGPFTR